MTTGKCTCTYLPNRRVEISPDCPFHKKKERHLVGRKRPLRAIKSKISQNPRNPNRPRHRSVIFVQSIPSTTKSDFKAMCVQCQESMRDAIIRLMRYYTYTGGVLNKAGNHLFEGDICRLCGMKCKEDVNKASHAKKHVYEGRAKALGKMPFQTPRFIIWTDEY